MLKEYMTETANHLDYEDEVTGIRSKSSLSLMDILSRMDEGIYEEGEDELRSLAEKNNRLDLFEKFKEADEDEGELRFMVALKDLTEEQLKELAQTKHDVGFHGGVPKILADLFRITGDPKFSPSLD